VTGAPGNLAFAPLTAERWGDLERLFGPERGACGGCWCMWFRVTRAESDRLGKAGRKAAFRALVEAGKEPGVLAFAEGEPVGWCAVEPRAAYPSLDRSKVSAPRGDGAAWAITCFYIAPRWRRKGLMRPLIEAACAHARAHGATLVEAWPRAEGATAASAPRFVGVESSFRGAGFEVVARPTRSRSAVRRRLG
jgi:GNAT superfamily N-acetyltransferase